MSNIISNKIKKFEVHKDNDSFEVRIEAILTIDERSYLVNSDAKIEEARAVFSGVCNMFPTNTYFSLESEVTPSCELLDVDWPDPNKVIKAIMKIIKKALESDSTK